MNIEVFEKEIRNKMKKINIELNDKQIIKFYNYMKLLIEWNSKINLTAITEPQEIILKHFVDSVTIYQEIKGKENMIDIGTGAGFPGIPISILDKDINIVLVDSLNKRISFLKEVIKELSLENIEVIHSRVEDLAIKKEYREKFDVVTSRAVAGLATLSEYMLPFCNIKGRCILMKGSKIQEELSIGEKAIKTLGGKIKNINKIKLPDTNMERNIIIIEKEKNTPKEYPRKAGEASRKPII